MIDHANINAYYQDLAQKRMPSQIVGWKNKTAQHNRFSALCNLFNKEPFTVNDVGSGLGDLYVFLKQAGFSVDKYIGYDLLDEMVNRATKLHIADKNARFELSANEKEFSAADYTIASGIFNLQYNNDDILWKNYIKNMLGKLDRASEKGFAFNMLTSYSDEDRKEDRLFYADPCYYFDYCKRHFSKNVALLHDYEEYDFTIIVRKI